MKPAGLFGRVGGFGVVLCLLMTSLAGCDADAVTQEGFMSYDEMRAEYDRTLENFPDDLPFPEGVNTHPPLESQTVTDPETTDLFQTGSGESQAYIYWECTWMVQALEAGDDRARLDEALDMLESALDSRFHRLYYEDPGRVWELEVLGGARTGDLSSLKDFAVGCDVES
ncbi:hypothetical protein [Microbacterium sp. T2.11-28]|uniref:hypothetical protein n=1 Tax=Microbacterium sp. T2.11-28 TaxID=3041169 RepID=UPI002477562D|nr:hypothetical protein [Microbacterium sp. T2.11-28]CAI9392881.1 hypothetical protein MICABA_02259 [Microbacterium sp. T2.11-28]